MSTLLRPLTRHGLQIPIMLLVFLLASAVPAARANSTKDIPQPDSAVSLVQAQTSVAPAGTVIQAHYSDTIPAITPAELATTQTLAALSNRTGPVGTTAAVPFATDRGPETAAPSAAIPLAAATTTQLLQPPPGDFAPRAAAPTDFSVFRNSVIPGSAIAGGYGYASNTQEPSTAANGKNVFQTGNWYASRSFNNGASWSYLNPFSIFGTGFCCDQVTLYDAGRDHQFWLLQYGNHLALANSSGSSLFGSWCYYNIDATWFGYAAGTADVDYNDLALGTNDIYIASNLFPHAGGSASGLLRLPIDAMTTCSGFSYSRVTRTDSFTFKPVQGAADVMYWGSNWGQTNGSSFRVYRWAENSSGYSYTDHTIAAFTFESRNNGQNCGSADGVVKNWCQFADSRVLGGYRANGVLGFSFNASQGAGFPFPYTRWVFFRESDSAYLNSASLWASWAAIQFLQLAPNARGHIGGTFAWGGGTGTTHYYPGSALLIDDDISPSQPWATNFYLYGAGNTCTYGGIYRWGDYLTARQYSPAGYAWIAAGYAIKGANCGSSGWYAEPHNVIFGRSRDGGSVYRWWNS